MLSYRERKAIEATEEYRRKVTPTSGPHRKRDRVWAWLNSPFAIWLFSTVVLGAGVSIFTDEQNCLARVNQLSERLTRLGAEVRQREEQFFAAVIDAKSDAELERAASLLGPATPYRYIEFKDHTLAELEDEYHAIRFKLRPGLSKQDWTAPTQGGATANIVGGHHPTEDEIRDLMGVTAFGYALSGGQLNQEVLKLAAPVFTRERMREQVEDLSLAAGDQCSLGELLKNRIAEVVSRSR